MTTTDERYRVETRVGHLVEARVLRLTTREDVDVYGAAIAHEVRRAGPGAVLCANHRAVKIYPPAAADRLIEMFKPNNTRFARIALVINPANAVLLMQLERIVREAGSENRRVFAEPAGALAHLAPALDAREQARARAFLAEHDTVHTPAPAPAPATAPAHPSAPASERPHRNRS